MEFITAGEFKKIIDTQDLNTMNEVLSRVYNKAVESAIQMTPALTAQLIKTAVGTRKITDKFLSDNPKFKGNEVIVEELVRSTEIENPGMTYQQILETATPRINKRISEVNGQLRLINPSRNETRN